MTSDHKRVLPINRTAVRQRLHELRLSERDLAKACGFAAGSIRNVVANGTISTSFTVAELRNLKNELGLTWSDLFVEPSPEAAAQDDVPVLVQVLTGQPKAVPEDRLARTLGWDLERLNAAVTAADQALAPLGLMLHAASSGLLIRAKHDQSTARATLDTLRDDEVGLNQSTARVLREAWAGELSPQEDRNDHQVQLGRLHNLGVPEDRRSTGGSRHTVSDETAYCFDF